MPTARVPVLFDTDIGSDIDDAVCLAYLLKQPACEPLGVTTVTGNTCQRASLAAAVCAAAGRPEVPIHAGAPGPLLIGPGQPQVPHYEAIAALPHRTDFIPGTAIEFLRRTIREHPGEITLLSTGPLTNLALLFALDPELPALLKQLVMMCGVFLPSTGFGPGACEWNARVDPLATAMVYRARPAIFSSIGLDVTMPCRLPAAECQRRFAKAGGPLETVARMASVWFRNCNQIIFHDPLAGATIFDPTICQYARGLVTIETTSPTLAGLTSFQANTDGNPHQVATSVDAARFFEHYFAVVGG